MIVPLWRIALIFLFHKMLYKVFKHFVKLELGGVSRINSAKDCVWVNVFLLLSCYRHQFILVTCPSWNYKSCMLSHNSLWEIFALLWLFFNCVVCYFIQLFIYYSELYVPFEFFRWHLSFILFPNKPFIFILSKPGISTVNQIKLFKLVELTIWRNGFAIIFLLHVVEIRVAVHEFIIKPSRTFSVWIR